MGQNGLQTEAKIYYEIFRYLFIPALLHVIAFTIAHEIALTIEYSAVQSDFLLVSTHHLNPVQPQCSPYKGSPIQIDAKPIWALH